MSIKTEAIKRFLTAARSLANQGLSKEAIMNFARNEFGEITELFQKQIDNIFKRPASGIEKLKVKDEIFDDTVIKLPIDDTGQPFNPRDPMKQYGKPKKTEKEIMEDVDFPFDGPDDPKKYYTGGIVDVEPSLSDIGHGSDALMARTRLMSPGSQATTSTGLNYLLAEDNDNIRVPFSKGKLADKGRRKFMQLAGTSIGGLAALKAGLINLAKDAGPKVEMVRETVSKTPEYFFDLVSKIKMFGKEGTPLSERMNVTNYKNFELTEDIATGDMRITKQAGDPDGPGYKEEVMEYSKGGNPMEEGGQTIERYEEATLFPDMDGKMKDIEDGIEPDSIKEIMEEITEIKKADGGRIGFSKGKLAKEAFLTFLSKLSINPTTSRFLEKVFGKKAMAEMPKRDPELFKGLLETTEMYRKRDKEGLKTYMKGFLPHMDDAELEEFIIGNPEIGDMSGVLLRLGSGRDYKAKIDMINEANKKRKLADLKITEEMKRKPNASGGLANLLGE